MSWCREWFRWRQLRSTGEAQSFPVFGSKPSRRCEIPEEALKESLSDILSLNNRKARPKFEIVTCMTTWKESVSASVSRDFPSGTLWRDTWVGHSSGFFPKFKPQRGQNIATSPSESRSSFLEGFSAPGSGIWFGKQKLVAFIEFYNYTSLD